VHHYLVLCGKYNGTFYCLYCRHCSHLGKVCDHM
jgi:hypothetical protein